MTASQLRLLLAICRRYSARRTVTVRKLVKDLGFASTNSIFGTLRILRRKGLVAWDDGAVASIRPTCLVTLYPAAFQESR